MNQPHMEQHILEAISRHAEELTEAEVAIDQTFFEDLETALSEASRVHNLDKSVLRLIHKTLHKLQADWKSADQCPDNRGPLPAAV